MKILVVFMLFCATAAYAGPGLPIPKMPPSKNPPSGPPPDPGWCVGCWFL